MKYFLLLVTVLPISMGLALGDGVPFSDVDDSVYKEAIYHLRGEGIVGGYDDGSFGPERTINRAEFLKIVIGAKHAEDMERKNYKEKCFDDVWSTQAWYVPYACFAKERGIISGYEGKYLKADNEINVVEAAKIISNVYGDKNVNLKTGGEWYEPFMKYLLENRLLPSSVVSFDKVLTRGEMAEMISRAVRLDGRKLDSYLDFRTSKYGDSYRTWEEFNEAN